MLPPLVVQFTETSTVSSFAVSDTATKSAVRSVNRVMLDGERFNLAAASGGAVDRAAGSLHVVSMQAPMTGTTQSRASRSANLERNIISSLLWPFGSASTE